MKLSNLGLFAKLLIAFSIIALIAGAAGVSAILYVNVLDDKQQVMYYNHTEPLGQGSNLTEMYQRSRVVLRDVILNDDPASIADEIANLQEKFDAAEAAYQSILRQAVDPSVHKALQDYKAALDAYLPIKDAILALAKDNNDDEAIAFMNDKANDDRAVAVTDAVDALNIALVDSAKTLYTQNARSADFARMLLSVLIGVAVLAALSLGFFVARNLRKPIHRVATIANAVAAGDLSRQVGLNRNDEIGRMGQALDTVIRSVRNLVNDTNALSSAAKEGNLTMRADTERHQGEYRAVIEGVNDTLDAALAPMETAAAQLARMAKGEELPILNEDVFQGEPKAMIANLNSARASLYRMLEDSTMLAQAAAEGKLSTRADLSRHMGDFAQIIAGINHTLDAVLAPVEAAAAQLALMAKGEELPVLDETQFQGDPKVMIANLNEARDSLYRMLEDSGMLAQAAKEGRLSARADLSQHMGSFAQIIGGINDTLDAALAPVQTAAAQLERMAQGEELPVLDEEAFLGEPKTMIVNLNLARASLYRMLEDSNMLAQAANQGKLSTRADISRHQGGYAQIISSINSTLDAVISPLNTAARQLELIANGEDQSDIDTSVYRGDFHMIHDSLNRVRDSLNLLLDDTKMLTAAAVEGRFSTRADLSRHKGGYADIVHGINQTLDGVVTPFNEFIAVLGRMAVNDYTVKVEGSYHGMPKEMSDAINTTLGRVLSVQSVLEEIASGDTKRLEHFLSVGRRSDNDRMIPAIVKAMTTLENLVAEANRLSAAATAGDLEARGDADQFVGKYSQMIRGINDMLDAIAAPMSEAMDVLGAMAGNDYTTDMGTGYNGSFRTFAESVNRVQETLNEVLGDLASAADQVASGTRQVSDGSQALSQGATEQASAIEQLSASVTEIASQTKQNAMDAGRANAISTETREHALSGNSQMGAMLTSMNEINAASANISRIIKVIDDIAFQTNLLALNAAVEAARAGTHGKGFAVVAEEVRNLAGRSANAAKETTAMIEGSMRKAAEGTRIANETAQALGKIVEGVEKSTDLITSIAKASSDQATAVSQVNRGIEQVSQVVQTNSATAEQSAATSEELSSQAELLQQTVARFRLKGSNAEAQPAGRAALAAGREEPRSRRRISLSDSEFGKY